MMDLPLSFYLIAATLVFLTGVSKTGLAAGIGSLWVPIMSFYIPPAVAAGIFLPILIAIDSTNIWNYRKHFQKVHLKYVASGALIGVGFGTLSFGTFDPAWVRLLVGLIALSFSAIYYFDAYLPRVSGKMPMRYGILFGLISGFTSHLAHAGGPPIRAFLLNQNLEKSQMMGTFGFFFVVVNILKLPPYLYFGQVNWATFQLSLILAPIIVFGVYFGLKLHKSLSQVAFIKIAYIFLTLAGLKLTYDGLSLIL